MARNTISVRKHTELQDRLSSLRRRNTALARTAKGAQTPMEATAYTQMGGVAAGLISVYVPADKQDLASLITAITALGWGSTKGDPRAVAFGNGVAAVLTAEKTREALVKRRGQQGVAVEAA